MKSRTGLSILLCVLMLGPGTAAWSALYHWVDPNGVHYYSNEPPLGDAEIVEVLPETPYDEQADTDRMERYRQWRQRQRRELEERLEQIRAEEEAQRAEERRRAEEARRRREAERKAREEREAKRRKEDRTDEKSVQVNPGGTPLGLNPGPSTEPPENPVP
jgi:hypothetical protein